MSKTDWPKEPLTNEILQQLDRILEDWCTEHDCDTSSDRGQAAARALFNWVEFGVRDDDELSKLLREERL